MQLFTSQCHSQATDNLNIIVEMCTNLKQNRTFISFRRVFIIRLTVTSKHIRPITRPRTQETFL